MLYIDDAGIVVPEFKCPITPTTFKSISFCAADVPCFGSAASSSETDSKITVTCSNHWSNWNLKKGRHFTDESQQLAFTSDVGLEYAHITKADIRWGS